MTKVRSGHRAALLAATMSLLAMLVWGCQAKGSSVDVVAPDYAASPVQEKMERGAYLSDSLS